MLSLRSRVGLLLLLLLLSSSCNAPPLLLEEEGISVDPLSAHLIQISEAGIQPDNVIEVENGKSSLTFFNKTQGRLISIYIPGTDLQVSSCTYNRGFTGDESARFTKNPLAPGQSANLCIFGTGQVPFEVYGIDSKPLKGRIVIVQATDARMVSAATPGAVDATGGR